MLVKKNARTHSFLSKKCVIKNGSTIHNFGMFAKEKIKKGELVLILGGGSVLSLQETIKHKKATAYSLQIFEDFFFGPRTMKDLEPAYMINHSCNPNAGVKGQIIFIARKAIKKDEEICFDYETTEMQDTNFVCQCGSKKCRGKITGKAWKDPNFQKRNKGYLSWYLQEKIKRLKFITPHPTT